MTNTLDTFGYDPPLRASSLPLLIACNWRATMLHLNLITDDSGVAADTGSLIHAGVEAWHNHPRKELNAAVERMLARVGEFPLADADTAKKHLAAYADDPRNQAAEVVETEKECVLILDPHPSDATGRPVKIVCHLDQLRNVNGRLRVYDLKTGKRYGDSMLNHYAYQIAAYTCAAGPDVEPGALIRTQGYFKRGADPKLSPPDVYWEIPWGRREAVALMDHVRFLVARVRAGEPWQGPGDHCGYCPAGGLDRCLPMYLEACA